MGFVGFMGMPMDEKIFANMQKNNPWFVVNDIFDVIKPLVLSQKKQEDGLTLVEMQQYIFAKIFGSFGLQKSLVEAENLCKNILKGFEEAKPASNQTRDNENWMVWQHKYGGMQILLGTVYAYKQEFIKSVYHFMLGLKTEMVNINMPYVDFILYVVDKIKDLPKDKTNYKGRGFDQNNPMGYVLGERALLDAQIALEIIPEMEGENGEVIIAQKGNSANYGYVERHGSVRNNIDVYKTWLIDKDYNLKLVEFYFYGYRSHKQKQPIYIADGFKIKNHSALHNKYEFI